MLLHYSLNIPLFQPLSRKLWYSSIARKPSRKIPWIENYWNFFGIQNIQTQYIGRFLDQIGIEVEIHSMFPYFLVEHKVLADLRGGKYPPPRHIRIKLIDLRRSFL